MEAEKVWERVMGALMRTKNSFAPSTDRVRYRLIKAVHKTKLGAELRDDVGGCLMEGRVPPEWREIRVVLIQKPRRDLTLTKNWRPLNLINCVRKLGVKMVADIIQDSGEELHHHLQYGSLRGRSAVDVLYRSVKRTRLSMSRGGSIGWAF